MDGTSVRILNLVREATVRSDLDSVCDYVFESFQEIIPFDRIGIALLDVDGQISLRWVKSKIPSQALGLGYSSELRGSSLEKILQTRKPRIIEDLVQYLHDHPNSDSTRRIVADGIRSSLTCPLSSLENVLGFIFFSSRTPDTYTSLHVQMFELIAAQIGFVVERGLQDDRLEVLTMRERQFHRAARDLESPTQIIESFADLGLEGGLGELTPELRKALELILRQTKMMSASLRSMSSNAPLNQIPSTVGREVMAMGDFLERFRLKAELMCRKRKNSFSLILNSTLPRSAMNRWNDVDLVLTHLVENALKFSRPETNVELSARLMQDNVLFSVRDEGQGIPRLDVPKLFTSELSGNGLMVCKGIAETHGGRIWAETNLGKGSVFHLLIPIQGPESSQPNVERSAPCTCAQPHPPPTADCASGYGAANSAQHCFGPARAASRGRFRSFDGNVSARFTSGRISLLNFGRPNSGTVGVHERRARDLVRLS